MSKKIVHLTGSMAAAEHLRTDVENGNIHIYSIPNFPTGIIPPGYLDKCSSVVVASTGSNEVDYLVIMPIRPDKQKSGSGKDLDIDPVIFCFKQDNLQMFPTGAALYHQNFTGRTSPLYGFETFTVTQTVAELRNTLITGSQPLSGSPQNFLNAISHSIGKLDEVVGSNIKAWLSASLKSPPGSANP